MTSARFERATAGTVQFGGTRIAYSVRRSARRATVGLRVSADGVEVAAPAAMDDVRLAEIVRAKGAWILGKRALVARQTQEQAATKTFVNGEGYRYLGRQYRLKRVAGLREARLRGAFLEVPNSAPAEVRAALLTWYRRQAERRLPERAARHASRLGLPVPKVLVRDQRQRWGSCNAKGELRLNWQLVQLPARLQDYVLLHELVHLEHLDHSKAYWRRLGQVLPDHATRRLELPRWAAEARW